MCSSDLPDLLGRLEALGDLHADAQHERRVERHLVGDERPEVAARHELHLEERVVPLLAEGVDLRDVRVDETRRGLGLALELLDELREEGSDVSLPTEPPVIIRK